MNSPKSALNIHVPLSCIRSGDSVFCSWIPPRMRKHLVFKCCWVISVALSEKKPLLPYSYSCPGCVLSGFAALWLKCLCFLVWSWIWLVILPLSGACWTHCSPCQALLAWLWCCGSTAAMVAIGPEFAFLQGAHCSCPLWVYAIMIQYNGVHYLVFIAIKHFFPSHLGGGCSTHSNSN